MVWNIRRKDTSSYLTEHKQCKHEPVERVSSKYHKADKMLRLPSSRITDFRIFIGLDEPASIGLDSTLSDHLLERSWRKPVRVVQARATQNNETFTHRLLIHEL